MRDIERELALDHLIPEQWLDDAYIEERRKELTARFHKNMTPELRSVLEVYKSAALQAGADLWLIGSTIPLVIENLQLSTDYDLITSEIFSAPEGYATHANRYRNPKHRRGATTVDLIPLHSIYSIVRRCRAFMRDDGKEFEFTMENFLTGTPMAHQSIAYDLQREEFNGTTGVFAITTRTIFPNDVTQLAFYASRKEKGTLQLMEEHAKKLNYTLLPCHEGFLNVFLPPCAMHPKP